MQLQPYKNPESIRILNLIFLPNIMLAFSTADSQRHINAHSSLLKYIINRLSNIKNIKILVDTAAVLPSPNLDPFYPSLPVSVSEAGDLGWTSGSGPECQGKRV